MARQPVLACRLSPRVPPSLTALALSHTGADWACVAAHAQLMRELNVMTLWYQVVRMKRKCELGLGHAAFCLFDLILFELVRCVLVGGAVLAARLRLCWRGTCGTCRRVGSHGYRGMVSVLCEWKQA